jgi:hypothetical protein
MGKVPRRGERTVAVSACRDVCRIPGGGLFSSQTNSLGGRFLRADLRWRQIAAGNFRPTFCSRTDTRRAAACAQIMSPNAAGIGAIGSAVGLQPGTSSQET